ncbi:transcriptional regulator, partial [Streptomyces griseus]|nr:transcriptional regulator [Streptomyces griseus]
MPFRLHFGESDLLRCRFALSPLFETQEAVRTLHRTGRHGYHLPWLRRIREASEALDLEPLWLLMPSGGHNPDFICPPPIGPLATFEEEIAAVRAVDPEVARADMAQALADRPGGAASAAGRRLL